MEVDAALTRLKQRADVAAGDGEIPSVDEDAPHHVLLASDGLIDESVGPSLCRGSGIVGGRAEEASEHVGRSAIGLRKEVRVHVEGRRRVAVTEATSNRPHVNAGGQELRRHVVAEIMKPHAFEPRSLAESMEPSGDRIGVPRLLPQPVPAEQQGARRELNLSETGSVLRALAVGSGLRPWRSQA
jgi:hypothetical protein